jgi:hypothetical protein
MGSDCRITIRNVEREREIPEAALEQFRVIVRGISHAKSSTT